MHMVYDVAHNTAKLEKHLVDGEEREVLVHRKGATRAFGPGMPGLPDRYRETGQPVIIGGSMETGSYLLAGMAGAAETFYTTAHGSGRTMSRHQAKKMVQGRKLLRRHGAARHLCPHRLLRRPGRGGRAWPTRISTSWHGHGSRPG